WIVKIAGNKDNARWCGHRLDQKISQQEMREIIQLERFFKTVVGEFQNFRFRVDTAGVENEAADRRNLHGGQHCGQAAAGIERKEIERRKSDVRMRIRLLDTVKSLLCLCLIPAGQEDLPVGPCGKVLCRRKSDSDVCAGDNDGSHLASTDCLWR